MKKAFTIFAVVAGLFVLSEAAFGSQNILSFIAKNFTGGGAALLNVDATGNLLESNGALAINNVSGAAVSVKTGASRLVEISVVTAGSATGSAYDVVLPASAAAANQVMTIPNTVGLYQIDWPIT
ncbi:MAG TPA: hypothetical protein VFM18_09100, partial [Methanosarcina sp.]|nr:hypothetical protein [Methanosarcina sp.]